MKALIFLISITLLFSCTSKKLQNDLEKNNLKGRVSIITESEYSTIEKFGELQKEKLGSKGVHKYNENGSLIEESFCNSNGVDERKTYSYDSKGNMIEKRSNFESEFYSQEAPVIKYKYDEKGNVIEEDQYHLDGSLDKKWYYKHDEKGNILSKSTSEDFKTPYKKENGNLILLGSTTEYLYDRKGNLILETNDLSKDTFQYDINNNIIVHDHFLFGELNCKEIYKYDNSGNKLEYTKYNSKGDIDESETYKYDKKGSTIEKKSHGYRNLSKYDDKGLLLEEYGYEINGDLSSQMLYVYDQFDIKGNWIKRRQTGNLISFLNSQGKYEPYINTEIVERDIEYY